MSAAIAAAITGAVAAAAAVSLAVYNSTNAPEQKLPTTQRERSRQIESKLLPALQKKLVAEQSKAKPDQDKLRQLLQDIQDLQDEDKFLLSALDDAHAQAEGLSGKDAKKKTADVAAQSGSKINPNAIALVGAGVVAVSIVGVAAVIARKKKHRG